MPKNSPDTPPDPAAAQADAHALKGRRGFVRLTWALRHSLAGLAAAVRHESAFRQLLALNLILIPIACLVEVSSGERALLIVMPLMALVVELLNSAIEAVVDRISLDLHPLSKRAKDMGSAAQLLTLLAGALVWALILL